MKQKFDVTGMTCSACSAHVEKSVSKLEGVQCVNVNLLQNSMVVEYDDNALGTTDIIHAVESGGYGASVQGAVSYTHLDVYKRQGWETVGTTFDFKHLAATPVGMKVRVVTELTEVNGKLLTFAVKAYDEVDKICEGTHGRAIIDLKKFLSRVNEKGKK